MRHHNHPQITRPLRHSKTFPLSETRAWYQDPINYRDPFHIAVALSHPTRVRPAHAHRSTRGRLWDIALDRRTNGTTFIATDPRTSASFEFFANRAYIRWEADNLPPHVRTLLDRIAAAREADLGEPLT